MQTKTLLAATGVAKAAFRGAIIPFVFLLVPLLAWSSPVTTCPANATATGVAVILTVFHGSGPLAGQPVGLGTVGACELLYVQAAVAYTPQDVEGNTVSGFSDGTIQIAAPFSGWSTNATPTSGIPLIGPLGADGCPNATPIYGSKVVPYLVTPADVAAGNVLFIVSYTGGTAWIEPGISNAVAGTTAILVKVAPWPRITLTKRCLSATNITGDAVVVTYSGTISNAGSGYLTNIVVGNNQPAPGTRVFTLGSLAAGQSVSFTNSYTNRLNLCGVFADDLFVTAEDQFQCPVSAAASDSCAVVYTPAIAVTKLCPPPVQPGELLTYSGTVSNAGNVVLTNVFVLNNQPVAGTVLLGPITLGLGQSTNFTGSYRVAPDSCGPYVDTVTAFGTSICGISVTNHATRECPGTNAPGIVVTKVCPPEPVQPGGTMVVTGGVTNVGNITLVDVVVTNVIGALGQSRRIVGPMTLAPGAGVAFSDSYVVPLDSCGPYLDTVVARGADKCFGRVVTASATRQCAGTNTPAIKVFKICSPNPVAPGEVMVFSGIVSNAGNITLTNVLVVNNRPTNNTPVFGPATLLPGQTASFTGSYILPADCCGCTDTLRATGADKCFGRQVVSTATVACPTTTTPRLVVAKFCPTEPVVLGQPLVFYGSVSNAGNITLTNVTVVNNQPTNNTPVLDPITLAAGQVVHFQGSYLVPINLCETNLTDTLTARGVGLCNGAPVTASATTACEIRPTPRLSLTKTCPPRPVPIGGVLVFSGIVSNSGNVTITNVLVVNDKPAPNTPVFGPVTLAPGEAASFTGSYQTETICCPPLVDTLTATGQDFCRGSNVVVTATAHCPGLTAPALWLSKVCPPTPVPWGQSVIFSGVVANVGDVTLLNVTIADSQAGWIAEIPALAPGEATSYMASYLPAQCGENVTCTVTVTALDMCTATLVSTNLTVGCAVTCPTNQPVNLILTPDVARGTFLLSFATESGRNYRIEYTDSLLPVSWQVLTNLAGNGAVITIPEPATNQQRYYRVVIP